MFKLMKESGLVKVWVGLVLTEVYTENQVPSLFNLNTLVSEVLAELRAAA